METLFESSALDGRGELLGEEPVLFLQRSVATLMQRIERLTDPQAAEATRKVVAWKYVLHLSLNHPGFQAASFCVFRHLLFSNVVALQVFQSILTHIVSLNYWPNDVKVLDSAETLLASLCGLTQSYYLEAAFEQALQSLAVFYPVWLRQIALPRWYMRTMASPTGASGPPLPPEVLAADITYLFKMLAQPEASEIVQLAEIRRLRWGWQHNCAQCPACSQTCAICTQCIVGAGIANGMLQP
jgi:hypothetical protein